MEIEKLFNQLRILHLIKVRHSETLYLANEYCTSGVFYVKI